MPGKAAHLLMMPEIRSLPYRNLTAKNGAIKSAVLLLLYQHNGLMHIVFTLRSKKLSNHSGQISFPGGHIEKGEDAVATALREAREEIGIDEKKVLIIGRLSDLYVPPTNYLITPVVGFMPEKPDSYINSPDEVEEILDIPLDIFIKPGVYSIELWDYNGSELKVPLWKIHPETPLWGATSMIMSEFLSLYSEFRHSAGN